MADLRARRPARHSARNPASAAPAVAERTRTWPLATAAVAVATAAAAASWTRVFDGHHWVAPVAITAAATHAAAWTGRKFRLNAVVASGLGLVVVALLAIWTVLGSATTDGLPQRATLRAFGDALRQARLSFPTSVAPVATLRPFVLFAVLVTGLAALAADGLAFRARRPLQAALAPAAVFVVCSVSGTSQHRAVCTGLLVGGIVIALAVQRATVASAGDPWLGDRRWGAARSHLGATALVGTVAVVASVIVVPGSTTPDGHGAFGWKGDGPGGGSTNRSVISPVVDLQTRLEHQGTTPVFTVDSPVGSYWRLTSLDTFTGVQWQSTDTYHGVAGGLPGLQAAANGRPTVTERFHIQSLASIWMPTAFNPWAVHGGGDVSWDPVSDSLLAGRTTSDGLTYTLDSVQYLSGLSGSALAALPMTNVDQGHTQYLELPGSVPPSVYDLAQQITAGAHSEYAEALALQDYFVDNASYHYSLDPPDDGYGTAALTDFLFSTHTGYCQQFAGAYAVLARAAGLPTRLAVGFTTGTDLGGGHYQVTDADAHTWPEVWFGPTYGWLPFEPTKGGDFDIPGATGYTGDTAGAAKQTTQPTVPTTTPVTTPSTLPLHHVVSSSPVQPQSPAPPTTGGGRSTSPVLVVVALAGAAVVGWAALGAVVGGVRRRRRHRASASLPPELRRAGEVMATWADVVDALALWGLLRRPDETIADFARRACADLNATVVLPGVAARLVTLSRVVEMAAYRPGPLDPATAAEAARLADDLQDALHGAASTQLRLRRLADPRLVWRTAAV